MKRLGIFLCLSAITAGVLAAEYVVEQKGKAFSSKAVTIKVGDAINFKNADPFNHNVFSLSDAKSFDLAFFPRKDASEASVYRGTIVFMHYCVNCHGVNADGKARAVRLHEPKPVNLRASMMNDLYKEMIINRSGKAMGRSGWR